MDKEEKRRAKQMVRAKERAEARAAMPLDPRQLRTLFDWLDVQLAVPCDHTLRFTLDWLEAHDHDADVVVPWLEDNGGYCDCEVLANVEQKVDDALRVVITVVTNSEDFAIAHAVVGHDKMAGEDRVAVALADGRILIALADGAGGTGGGAAAADMVVRQIDNVGPDFDPVRLLGEADHLISRHGGQSTGIILSLSIGGVSGASVGDSEVWLIRDSDDVALTAFQERKPLLGTGNATPRVFVTPPLKGTLVIATDGLFKYAPRQHLLTILRSDDLHSIPQRAVDLARLPSGDLQDDIAIVVCRPRL